MALRDPNADPALRTPTSAQRLTAALGVKVKPGAVRWGRAHVRDSQKRSDLFKKAARILQASGASAEYQVITPALLKKLVDHDRVPSSGAAKLRAHQVSSSMSMETNSEELPVLPRWKCSALRSLMLCPRQKELSTVTTSCSVDSLYPLTITVRRYVALLLRHLLRTSQRSQLTPLTLLSITRVNSLDRLALLKLALAALRFT